MVERELVCIAGGHAISLSHSLRWYLRTALLYVVGQTAASTSFRIRRRTEAKYVSLYRLSGSKHISLPAVLRACPRHVLTLASFTGRATAAIARQKTQVSELPPLVRFIILSLLPTLRLRCNNAGRKLIPLIHRRRKTHHQLLTRRRRVLLREIHFVMLESLPRAHGPWVEEVRHPALPPRRHSLVLSSLHDKVTHHTRRSAALYAY